MRKKVGIFGLGKTGIASYQTLSKTMDVICYDDSLTSRNDFASKYNSCAIVNITDKRWKRLHSIIMSPGISHKHKIFHIANNSCVPIVSDIDAFFELVKASGRISQPPCFVSITGTNGKSTTTKLIANILQTNYYDNAAGGNLGLPTLSMPCDKSYYILELSSFQLDLIKIFKTNIAILLNITPDHLDRYKDMNNYINSKKKIFTLFSDSKNSKVNISHGIISVDSDITRKMFTEVSKVNKIIPISTVTMQDQGIYVSETNIYDKIFNPITLELSHNKCLQGGHNRENIAASYAACRILGLTPKMIIKGLCSFQGIAHRMQYIGQHDGNFNNIIHFYNDSKATNVDAASKSIGALKNIYWILGGIAKENDLSRLYQYFGNIKSAYIFGQDKELLAKSLENRLQFKIHDNLEIAFFYALNDAMKDKSDMTNILLAPAASSLDQFKNFEERGELFMKLCNTIGVYK